MIEIPSHFEKGFFIISQSLHKDISIFYLNELGKHWKVGLI